MTSVICSIFGNLHFKIGPAKVLSTNVCRYEVMRLRAFNVISHNALLYNVLDSKNILFLME